MIFVLLGIFGLCFGSFINAFVWRVYEQSKKKTKIKANLSILNGRSICPRCEHVLAYYDLVPVLSWLSLRGRCRYCKKPISIQYPLVELSTAALFIMSYLFWPESVKGIQVALFSLWLATLVGLIALAVYDLKWRLLPNKIMYPIFLPAIGFALLSIIHSNDHFKAIADCIAAFFIGSGIFYLIFEFSAGKWIGGGDVKLGGVLGLIALTPAKSLLFIFLGSVIGSLISVPLMLAGKVKKNTTIPFGPLLIVGGFITVLFGTSIINWYSNLFLHF